MHNLSLDLSFLSLKVGKDKVLEILRKDIEKILKDSKFKFSVQEIPYGVSIKTAGFVVNIYSSGRVNLQADFDLFISVFKVIQKVLGQDKKEEIKGLGTGFDLFVVYLKKVIDGYLGFIDSEYVIGADEAGKSEAQGAIVVAGVGCRKENLSYLVLLGVSDSKRASLERLARLEGWIRKLCTVSVSTLTPEKLHKVWKKGNLNYLLDNLYSQVISDLLQKIPSPSSLGIYIDQYTSNLNRLNSILQRLTQNLKSTNITIDIRHKAEIFPHVAAASTIAKLEYERTKQSFTRSKPWQKSTKT